MKDDIKERLDDIIQEIYEKQENDEGKVSTLYKLKRKIIRAELFFTLTKAASLLETLEYMK